MHEARPIVGEQHELARLQENEGRRELWNGGVGDAESGKKLRNLIVDAGLLMRIRDHLLAAKIAIYTLPLGKLAVVRFRTQDLEMRLRVGPIVEPGAAFARQGAHLLEDVRRVVSEEFEFIP